jgi:hypothetical protein
VEAKAAEAAGAGGQVLRDRSEGFGTTHGEHVALTRENALQVLHDCGFHLYHAKSWNESLFIHSFSAYALVDGVLPFTQAIFIDGLRAPGAR